MDFYISRADHIQVAVVMSPNLNRRKHQVIITFMEAFKIGNGPCGVIIPREQILYEQKFPWNWYRVLCKEIQLEYLAVFLPIIQVKVIRMLFILNQTAIVEVLKASLKLFELFVRNVDDIFFCCDQKPIS